MSNFQSRKRRIREGEHRCDRGRLGVRRGPARQTDRDDIDVFQEAAVRRQHLTAHGRACERAFDFDIGIDARGQVIVPRHEHAVGFQTQIEIRFGQFRQIDRAADGERAAGEIAAEAVKSQQGVVLKLSCALKFVRAGRVAFSNRARLMFISAEPLTPGLAIVPPILTSSATVPSSWLQRGHKLPDEIDRAARHLDSAVDRRLLVQLLLRDHLGNIERQLRVDLHRLDARLLNFSSHFEFVILEAHREIDRRRLQLFDGIRLQALQLQIKVRLRVDQAALGRRA